MSLDYLLLLLVEAKNLRAEENRAEQRNAIHLMFDDFLSYE